MADHPRDRVIQYAQINSPIPGSGLYSRDVSLAKSRKHANPLSSDLVEPPSKRAVLSDSHGHVILGNLPSSPPLFASESDTEEDEGVTAIPSFSGVVAKNASRSDSASTLIASNPRLDSGLPVAHAIKSASFASRKASRGGSMLQNLTPVGVIRDAVDAGVDTVNLTERDIDELPSEIGDLEHWVSLDRATLKVCLGHNNLRFLNLGLFKVNVSELLLRHNQLEEIPQQIANLKNLNELSLGSNNLRFLPAELLTLPNLSVLSTVPNPWLPLPAGVQNTTADRMPSLIFRQVDTMFNPPTLVELAQRVLADHAFLGPDRKSWALSEHQQMLVDNAQKARERGHQCFHCRKPYIIAAASVTEWWNLCHNKALPFRKNYCSKQCLRHNVFTS